MSLPDAYFSVIYPLDAPHRLSQLRLAVSRLASPAGPTRWEGLAQHLFATSPVVVADPASAPAWSPVIDAPGERALAVGALLLALDHVEPERAEALRQATRDVAGWVYTAWEHGLGGEQDCCVRVVLLPSRPLRLAEARRLLELAQVQLGAGDPSALDRFHPAPCCPRERLPLARLERRPGWLLDVDRALAEGAMPLGRPRR